MVLRSLGSGLGSGPGEEVYLQTLCIEIEWTETPVEGHPLVMTTRVRVTSPFRDRVSPN
ncbi:MAG: hypothetical protein ABGX83_03715 [Nitrospira sp.]